MIRKFMFGRALGCALMLFALATAYGETAPEGFIPSSYTEAEQHAFFDAHMSVAVKEWFIDGRHPVPEVRQLMADRRDQIQKRYAAAIDVRLVSNYDVRSKLIKLGSAVENGVPVFTIFVPTAMDDYAAYRATGNPNFVKMFENSLIVGIVHELDHLAYGAGHVSASNVALDQEEASAWAHTCEGVIRLLVDKGMPISESDHTYYRAWLEGGRTTLSQSWNSFIRETHAPIRS